MELGDRRQAVCRSWRRTRQRLGGASDRVASPAHLLSGPEVGLGVHGPRCHVRTSVPRAGAAPGLRRPAAGSPLRALSPVHRRARPRPPIVPARRRSIAGSDGPIDRGRAMAQRVLPMVVGLPDVTPKIRITKAYRGTSGSKRRETGEDRDHSASRSLWRARDR